MSTTNIPYRSYILEATKITTFCLLITGLFKWTNISTDGLLIVFNMALMSTVATFSPEKKALSHIMLGSTITIISIILGGLMGFYAPTLAKFITIIYAGLAFLIPKTKDKTTIFITGTLMFLIFSALPFDVNHALKYLLYGLIVIILFGIFTRMINLQIHGVARQPEAKASNHKTNALIVVTALSLGCLSSYVLTLYSSISHLYWINLTILVIIQSSQQKNINTAIKRILVNLCGAVITVTLFNYIIPANFWINFIVLTLFLFLIFALGFSYVWRTLFIEMFVLGFTQLLGYYKNIIAIDRVILTIIGGGLVIFTTLLFKNCGRLISH